MDKYLGIFYLQKKELDKVIELCAEIQKNERFLMTVDTAHYLDRINHEESKGIKFIDIAKDYLKRMQPKFVFDPEEPIMNSLDFLKELELYAERKHKNLTILHMGMMPKILLDGRKYTCMLEMPRVFLFPFSIFFAPRTYGYRWVCIYEEGPAETPS
jgi:hypothetical protein